MVSCIYDYDAYGNPIRREMPEEMERQGYFDSRREVQFYPVTEEQYHKLAGSYLDLKNSTAPQYIVFYNGEDECEPVTKLRLSDAFINEDRSGDFEWTATVYNLNRGKNDKLLRKCKPLAEYMELVNRIRDN